MKEVSWATAERISSTKAAPMANRVSEDDDDVYEREEGQMGKK